MGFFLYRTKKAEQGVSIYERVGVNEVELAGKDGPIATFARNHASPGKPTWHLPETELLKHFEGDPGSHAVVIDLKPRAKKKVSLYRIKDIWGHSKNGWTPILLRLEALCVEEPVASAEQFKKEFDDEKAEAYDVFEFLYLNGDSQSGGWAWGPAGWVNGTLLFPDALPFFLSVLKERSNAEGKLEANVNPSAHNRSY